MTLNNIKWVFFSLFIFPITLFANSPVILNEASDVYPVGLYLDLLEDKEAQWTIQDVMNPEVTAKFLPNRTNVPNLGFTNSAYWARFQLKNTSKEKMDLLLEIGYPLHDLVEVHILDSQGNYQVKRAGDMLPFYEREIHHRLLLFKLFIPANNEQTIYLRFKTQGLMQIPIKLWKPTAFLENINKEHYIFGLYYGIMLVMALYNLFVFFDNKEKVHLYYVNYILFLTIMQLTINGLAFEYLWPSFPNWSNQALPSFIFLAVFSGYLFCKRFLDTRKHSPGVDSVFSVLIAVSLIGAIGSFFLPYSQMVMLGICLAIISPIIWLIAGLLYIKRGGDSIRYYTISWLVMTIGIIAFILKNFGILPDNFYTQYAMHIGSSIEVILLSLSLNGRINKLKEEKAKAQEALVSQKIMADTFEKFVPKQFYNRVADKGIESINLGSVDNTFITILFSDVRSFTELSEPMTPDEVFKFLNSYLSRMEPSIKNNGGFVDKFIGDAIMALFDLDTEQKGAYSSIDAAISMQKALVLYNKHRNNVSYPAIDIGIGIHSGDVMIGTVGSNERMDYTAIGNAVNIASRLEGLTKYYGAKIIVSRETMDLLEDRDQFKHRILDWLRVKGKKEPIEIYEIIENDSSKTQKAKIEAEYYIALGLQNRHKKEFKQALKYFKKGINLFPNDTALHFHYKNCNQLLQKSVSKGWDGAIDMKSK